MGFKLKTAQPKDIDRLIELYRLSYPLVDTTDEERYNYFMHNPRCTLDNVYILTDGNHIIGSLIGYPFTQFQEGIEVPVIGIANVMVAPDHRREGAASVMFEKALEMFDEDGMPASILYPFEHRFYRYMGWGSAGEIRQYRMQTSQLSEYLDVLSEDEFNAVLMPESDLPLLMRYYDAEARRYNGLLKRGEEYWRSKITAPPRQVVLAYYDQEIIGYLIYSLEELQADNFLMQEMVVHEWMSPTQEARDILLSFIARQVDQAVQVKIPLPPDEPLHLWMEDPRSHDRRLINKLYTPTAEIGLGWMYRIVNLQAAFECGRRFNGIRGELTIEMEDETLGDRHVTVVFSGKGASVDRADGKAKRAVRGEVDMLSQMFCGYMTAEQAHEYELLEFEGDAAAFCQQAFKLPPPRCYDSF